MRAFYAERFKNAADFTFFFVGAFSVDQVTPLLTTYLASLPSTGIAESMGRDMHVTFPMMVLRETVKKGQEPLSFELPARPSPAGQAVASVWRYRVSRRLTVGDASVVPNPAEPCGAPRRTFASRTRTVASSHLAPHRRTPHRRTLAPSHSRTVAPRTVPRIIPLTLPLDPGTRIGPYEVTAKIGEGGMGVSCTTCPPTIG